MDEDPSNNAEENLVALCGVCHDEAHSTRLLSKSLSRAEIHHHKQSWENEVKNVAIHRLSTHGHNQILLPFWSYFNVQQVLHVARKLEIDVLEIPSMRQTWKWGLVDANGFPDFDRSDSDVHSLYERFEQREAHAVHQALSDTVQQIVEEASPIDLSEVWTKSLLKELPEQHPIVSIHRGMRFSSSNEEGKSVRRAKYKKGGIELQFQINPALIYSNSGFSFFSGHSQVAALLLLRSAATDDNTKTTILKASPVALGSGFPRGADPRPHIAWEQNTSGEFEEEATLE